MLAKISKAEAIAGPLRGKKWNVNVSTFAFWFAWKKYRPDTQLIGAN